MGAPHDNVRSRAVGVVHNLSIDLASILPLREAGTIPVLVQVLRDNSSHNCQAASGTLQNMSRETASKQIILESSGLKALIDLLFSGSVDCQVKNVMQ